MQTVGHDFGRSGISLRDRRRRGPFLIFGTCRGRLGLARPVPHRRLEDPARWLSCALAGSQGTLRTSTVRTGLGVAAREVAVADTRHSLLDVALCELGMQLAHEALGSRSVTVDFQGVTTRRFRMVADVGRGMLRRLFNRIEVMRPEFP